MNLFRGPILNDGQLKALGEIAVGSAKTEAMLDHFIRQLTRLTQLKAEIIMDRKMLDAKFETVRLLGLLKISDERMRHKFGELVGAARKANTDRNMMLHGVWHPYALEHPMARLLVGGAKVLKKTSPGNTKSMLASDIERVALLVEKTTWDLAIFLETDLKLKPWLPPRVAKLPRPGRNPPRKSSKSQ